MDAVTLLEIAFTFAVIYLQYSSFRQTRRKAKTLGQLFPNESPMVQITTTEASQGPQLEVLAPASEGFQGIIRDTNQYLMRNLGSPAEFGILQDIAERNSAHAEEDATANATLPLYIGLMGTFLGVIVGLLSIAIDPSSSLTDKDLHRFIGGVLVAMTGSLCGLLLTVYSRTRFVNPAVLENGRKRRLYYVLIQSELLPAVGHSVSTALYALQENLRVFNLEFRENIGKFGAATRQASENMVNQQEMLRIIRSTNLGRVIKANATMIASAEDTAQKLGGFVIAVAGLQARMTEVAGASDRINSLLDRVRRFEESVNAVGDKIAVDGTVTARTVELVRKQMDSITIRGEVLKEYTDIQDTEMRGFLGEQQQRLTNVVEAAKQQINSLSEELKRSVQEMFTEEQVDKIVDSLTRLESIDARLEAMQRTANRVPISESSPEIVKGLSRICDLLLKLEITVRNNSKQKRGLWAEIRQMFARAKSSSTLPASEG